MSGPFKKIEEAFKERSGYGVAIILDDRVGKNTGRDLVYSGVVESVHGFLEEVPCGRMKMAMGHTVKRTPILKMGHGGVGIVRMRGMGWRVEKVLDEVRGVMEGYDGVLGLDGGEYGLPNG